MHRRWVAPLVVALLGVAALVAFSLALPIAFQEDSAATEPAVRPATTAEAEAAFTAALDALRRGDERAWREALPASGQDARQARLELYRGLSPLPWTSLTAAVEPVSGEEGRFDVRILGELDGVGPEDRIVAERLLSMERLGGAAGRTVVSDDLTSDGLGSQYFMAFHRPLATRGEGCVVVSDADWAATARELADAAVAGRERLTALGLEPDRPVMIFLYRGEEQLRASLGDPPEQRIKYFSSPVSRYPEAAWWPRDIGVLGPTIASQRDWMPNMLGHELTHAFTFRWFDDTRHAPIFILEGLATTVEGGRSYQVLRDEIAAGNPTLPLLSAMTLHNFWSSDSMDEVHLAYYEAGSVVQYVLSGWSLATLRDFATAVANSDMSEAGVRDAVERTLHVSWDDFVSGWKAYVQTLP